MKLQLAALVSALTLLSTTAAIADEHQQQWQGPYAGYSVGNHQDNDDQGDKDRDDHHKSCVNPAGNQRGWCKNHNRNNNCYYNNNGYPNNGQYPYPNNGQYPYPNNGQYNGCYNNNGYNGGYNNGNGYQNATIRGVITSVNGNIVNVLQGLSSVSIDATQAFRSGRVNGQLYPTRSITAQGYYDNSGYFHAVTIS